MAINLDVHGNTTPLEAEVRAAVNRIRKIPVKLSIDDKGATQPLGNMRRGADEFTKSMEAANARIIAFGASMAIINGVGNAFKALVRDVVEVEKSLADINVVMDLSVEKLDKFSDGLFKVAKETGQAFKVAADAATEYARQGLGVEESLRRTKDALILTRLTGMDSAEAVKSLTAAMNTYGHQIENTTQLVSKFAAVDVKFAVSAEDFADAISRTGSAAKGAGVDIDELIGIVTAAQQKTARGGKVIGNSLKTIFTRVGRTDTLNQLENLGIAVRDIEGNTLGAKKILTDLANTFDTLSDAQKAQIAQTVGGVFQINVLKAILGDAAKQNGILANATQISANATDEAIQKNEMLRGTIAAMASETGTAIKQLSSDIGEIALAPGIEKILSTVKGFAENLSGVLGDGESTGNRFATGLLKGIGNIITGPGLVVLVGVFYKLFGQAFRFTKDSLSSLIGITSEAQKQKAIQTSLVDLMGRNANLNKELLRTDIGRSEKEKIILGYLKAQVAEANVLNNISKQLASTLYTKGYGANLTPVRRGRAHGYVPNFAHPEREEAAKGGYAAGNIRSMHMPGEGSIIYNSAEKVKNFKGMTQPAIMPPKSSKAGKKYQQAFGDIHGFDPYAAGGYIPNFIKPDIKLGDRTDITTRKQAEEAGYSSAAITSRFGKKTVGRGKKTVGRSSDLQKINLNNLFPETSEMGVLLGFGTTDSAGPVEYKQKYSTLSKPAKDALNKRLSPRLVKKLNKEGAHSPLVSATLQTKPVYEVTEGDVNLMEKVLGESILEKKLYKHVGRSFDKFSHEIGVDMFGGKVGKAGVGVLKTHMDGSMLGGMLEAGVRGSLTNKKVSDSQAPFDFVGEDAKNVAKFIGDERLRYIESKLHKSAAAGSSGKLPMKILNQIKATGYIPNFFGDKIGWKIDKAKGDYSITGSSFKLDGFSRYLKEISEKNPQMVSPQAAKMFEQRVKQVSIQADKDRKEASRNNPIGFGRQGAKHYGAMDAVRRRSRSVSTKGLFIKDLGKHVKQYNKHDIFAVDKLGSYDSFLADGYIPNFAAAQLALTGGLVRKNKFGNIDRRQMTRLVRSNPYFNNLMNEYLTWDSFPKKDKRKLSRWLLKQGVSNRALQAYGLASMHGKSIAEGISNIAMAGGYIPNFANPLSDAIGRERAAGVPVSQIRVGSHGALMNKDNPLGLGVTNTKDEPNGLRDVFGANGYVPNYAFNPMDFVRNATNKFSSGMDYARGVGSKFGSGVDEYKAARDLQNELNKENKKLLKQKSSLRTQLSKGKKVQDDLARVDRQLERNKRDYAAAIKMASDSTKKMGAAGRVGGMYERIKGHRVSKFVGSQMSGFGGMGLMMGAPMIAGLLQSGREGETEQQRVNRMQGGSYRAGGALTGVATGAAMGMMLGPVGVAIGALVGGIVGFNSAVKEGEEALRQFKKAALEKDVGNFGLAAQALLPEKVDETTLNKLNSAVEVTLSESPFKSSEKGFAPPDAAMSNIRGGIFDLISQGDQNKNIDFGQTGKDLGLYGGVGTRAEVVDILKKEYEKAQKKDEEGNTDPARIKAYNVKLFKIAEDLIGREKLKVQAVEDEKRAIIRRLDLQKASLIIQERFNSKMLEIQNRLDEANIDFEWMKKFGARGNKIVEAQFDYERKFSELQADFKKGELSANNKTVQFGIEAIKSGKLDADLKNALGKMHYNDLAAAGITDDNNPEAVEALKIISNSLKDPKVKQIDFSGFFGNLDFDQFKKIIDFMSKQNADNPAIKNLADQLKQRYDFEIKSNEDIFEQKSGILKLEDELTRTLASRSEHYKGITQEIQAQNSFMQNQNELDALHQRYNETKLQGAVKFLSKQQVISQEIKNQTEELQKQLSSTTQSKVVSLADQLIDVYKKSQAEVPQQIIDARARGDFETLKSAMQSTNIDDLADPERIAGKIRSRIAKIKTDNRLAFLPNDNEGATKSQLEALNQIARLEDSLKILRSETIKQLKGEFEVIQNNTKQYEEQVGLLEKINQQIIENSKQKLPGSFSDGFASAAKDMRGEVEYFDQTLGTTVAYNFRDGLVAAMDAAIDRSKDLGDVLQNVAIGFLQAIQNAFLTNAANMMVSKMGFNLTKNEGGKIPRYSTGGSVPAMVSNGEYVMSREAVNKYGGAFMHGLNVRGSAPEKFSQGGLADAFGKLGTYQDSGLGQAFQNLDRGKMNNIYSKMSKAQPRQTIADRMKIIKNDISDFINNDRNMELFQQEYAKAQGQASSMLSNQPVQEIIPKKNWKQKLDAFTRDEKNINLFKQETKSQQKSLQDFFSNPPAQETSIGGQRRSGTVDLANQAVKERNFEKSFQKIPANKITEEKGLKSLIDNNAAKSIKPSPGGSGFIGSLLGGLFSVITAPFKMIGSIFGGLGKYQGGLIPKDIQKFAEGGDVSEKEEESKPAGMVALTGGGRRYESGKKYSKNRMSGFFYSQSGNVALQEDAQGMRDVLAKEEEARRAKEAKKAKKKQFIMGLVGAAASAAISYGMEGGFSGGSGASVLAEKGIPSGSVDYLMSNNPGMSKVHAQMLLTNAKNGMPGVNLNHYIPAGSPYSIGDLVGPPVAGQYYGGPINKYASGGHISGKPGIDQIPAMLSEGEYVIRASSARKLGRSRLDQINAGRFYDGGSVFSEEEKKQETSSSSGNTNNINISVNVTNGSESNEKSDSSQSGESQRTDDNYKRMSEKIKEQVVTVIVEEQRPGGLLSKTDS